MADNQQNHGSDDIEKKPDLRKIADLIRFLQHEYEIKLQLLENKSTNNGVIAVKIRMQANDALSSDPSEPIKGEKLQSYFNLAVKCL